MRVTSIAFVLGVVLLGAPGSADSDNKVWQQRVIAAVQRAEVLGTLDSILAVERRLRKAFLKDKPDHYAWWMADLSNRCGRLHGKGASSNQLYDMVMSAQAAVRSRVKVSQWCRLVSTAANYSLPWRVRHEELREPAAEWAKRRTALARLFLDAIGTVRGAIDRTLDIKNPATWPRTKASLPKGVTGFAGMDPKHVKDPKLRAEYERAIEENRRYLAWFNEQHMLRDFEGDTERLVGFVARMYKHQPSNPAELESLAQTKALTDKERAPLLALAKELRK